MTKMNETQQTNTTGYLAESITYSKRNVLDELRALKSEIAEMEKALEEDRLLPETACEGAGHLTRYAVKVDKYANTYNMLVRVGYMAVVNDAVQTPKEIVKALNEV